MLGGDALEGRGVLGGDALGGNTLGLGFARGGGTCTGMGAGGSRGGAGTVPLYVATDGLKRYCNPNSPS